MPLKKLVDPSIAGIVEQLQNAGYETYIVGGAVRDLLLDRIPKDYDIATAATPEEVKQVFRDRHVIIIGKRFRLVHLFHRGGIIEISTFRKMPPPQRELHLPGRKLPENLIIRDNEFGTAREDAQRRDFTVNAVFYDPIQNRFADFTSLGLDDLRHGCIRAIGEPALRFEEDPVRILRALKLAGQYGFSFEPETGKAVTQCLNLIEHASNARLTLELEKILKNPYGHRILKTFHDYGFLQKFLPYLAERWDTDQGRYALALLEERNRRMRSGLYRDSISLATALLTLPFAERELGGNHPGGLWGSHPKLQLKLWELVHTVLAPAAITRRVAAIAVRTLMLQPKLKVGDLKRLTEHPGYPHGRELALIQNNALWHLEMLEDSLPPPARHTSGHLGGDGRDERSGQRHGRLRQRHNSENRRPQ